MKRRRSRRAIAVAAALAFAAIPAAASASVQSFSTTFDPNSHATTFNPPPTLPLIPFSISYDNVAGTITFTEGGCDNNQADATWYLAGCQTEDFTLSGPTTEVSSSDQGDGPGPGDVSVTNVGGALAPQVTFTGTAVTDVYSSPLLQGLTLSYVTLGAGEDQAGGDNACFCDLFPDITQYMPGDLPQVSLSTVHNQTSVSSYGAFVNAPRASVTGVAMEDPSGPVHPTIRYSGLPPGISPHRSDNGALEGSIVKPGTYNVRATATAEVGFGSGQTRIAGSTGFKWTVRAARIQIPTGSGNAKFRPRVLTITGDGSGFFGGPTRHRLEPRRRSLSDLGRLHWTQYSATSARATGSSWDLYGPGPLGSDTQFENDGHIALHAYRPVDGVFTRLAYSGRDTFKVNGRTRHQKFHGTAEAQQSNGFWFW